MNQFKVRMKRGLENEPTVIAADDKIFNDMLPEKLPEGKLLIVTENGKTFPAVCEDGRVTMVASLHAGETLLRAASSDSVPNEVRTVKGDDRVKILIGNREFAEYVFSDKFCKPYFGPVMTSFGESFTRLDFEATEHPHHRSVFFGVGDVSLMDGPSHVDFWNEPEGCGIQRSGEACVKEAGAYATVSAQSLWLSHDEVPMLDAESSFTVYAQPEGLHTVDVKLTLKASYGRVTFGATKEAGPLGVRVADPLRVDNGGYMTNSYGAEGEGECWGRAANYCVYGGRLSGHDVGIAVFDNSKNERFPTTWHIRDYGLFAANNLYFRGGFDIPAGEKLEYNYRIIFFEGSPEEANINSRYIAYAG